ncbi:MAG: histidine kinase dimerization/phospho-acceptor domain-containing protein [Bacteroides stercoris]
MSTQYTLFNAIAGFANLLVYDPELSGAEKQEYAGIINTNTKLLLKLVDDVLQLSRMETANMSFDSVPRVFIICSNRFTRHIVC